MVQETMCRVRGDAIVNLTMDLVILDCHLNGGFKNNQSALVKRQPPSNGPKVWAWEKICHGL